MNPVESWHPQPEPQPQPVPPVAAVPPAVPSPQTLPAPIGQKRPFFAAALSLFPGMGHVYNGLYVRGFTLFLITMSLLALADRNEIFVPVAIFFWIFNVLDAYRQATLINYGYAQDLGLVDLPQHPRASQGGLAAGIILTLIGIVAVLEEYFHVDLEWVFDLWPVALLGLGLGLIWSSLRDRRRREA
ncbi:MAG: LiaI-LiaF-like domain-containing protein [Thermoanaerobaculia bacterium]